MYLLVIFCAIFEAVDFIVLHILLETLTYYGFTET